MRKTGSGDEAGAGSKPRPKKLPGRTAAKRAPNAPKTKPQPKTTAKAKPTAKTASRSDPPPPRTRRVALHWHTRAERAAKTMLRSLALLLLVLSVLELLRITLVPTPGSVAYSQLNLHPFASVRLYLHEGTPQEQVFQIGGNIALGFLLGFLLPQITPQLRGLIRVEAFTALFVIGIELVQYYFIPDTPLTVDVLILTAIGAAVGYVPLGRMFGMRLHPDHLHWWQRRLQMFSARRRDKMAA
jgi:VanZ like family